MRKHPAGAPGQRGFTLIEVMVALGITTFVLMGIVGTMRVTARANIDAQRAAEALGLAEGMVETIRNLTVAQFENIDWMHDATDGRSGAESIPSSCEHTGKPYGSIGTAMSGALESWLPGGAGGGCDNTEWKEWHEGPVWGASNVEFRRGVRFQQIDTDLVWIQVIVEWTNQGAVSGFENGRYDRSVTMEILRSRLETPR